MDHDHGTERYFEEHTPAYSLRRYRPVVRFLTEDAPQGSSLLDLGCGSGNVLHLLSTRAPLGDLVGIDASRNLLDQCEAALPGCTTYQGSALDADLKARLGRDFRYVVAGALLHHLVGATRRRSLALARLGLGNAWSLVQSGGSLIVVEPTFRPRWLMGAVFHAKRLVTRVTSRRVALFGRWNNLGAPVVSYFSHQGLLAELRRLPGSQVVFEHKRARRLPAMWRLLGVTERADSVIVARKTA